MLKGMPLQLAYHHMSRLLAVIAEEGETRLFVSVSVANLYAPTKPPFGNDVAQKFSSITYDVGEVFSVTAKHGCGISCDPLS